MKEYLTPTGRTIPRDQATKNMAYLSRYATQTKLGDMREICAERDKLTDIDYAKLEERITVFLTGEGYDNMTNTQDDDYIMRMTADMTVKPKPTTGRYTQAMADQHDADSMLKHLTYVCEHIQACKDRGLHIKVYLSTVSNRLELTVYKNSGKNRVKIIHETKRMIIQ